MGEILLSSEISIREVNLSIEVAEFGHRVDSDLVEFYVLGQGVRRIQEAFKLVTNFGCCLSSQDIWNPSIVVSVIIDQIPQGLVGLPGGFRRCWKIPLIVLDLQDHWQQVLVSLNERLCYIHHSPLCLAV